jgi:hypothetical protein
MRDPERRERSRFGFLLSFFSGLAVFSGPAVQNSFPLVLSMVRSHKGSAGPNFGAASFVTFDSYYWIVTVAAVEVEAT